MAIKRSGFLRDNTGTAIEDAKVELFAKNATTTVLAEDDTDSNGYWSITYSGGNAPYDVRISKGSSVRFHSYDVAEQMAELEVKALKIRENGDEFTYDIISGDIGQNWNLTLPNITSNDTFAVLGLAQTFSAAITFSGGIANSGTIAAGTWNGTDIGVAYGGTGASSLTDGGVLLGSGSGAITAMSVLADGEMIVGDGTTDPVAESGATLRTSIGVGTGNSPQFTGIELGHASDTTIARSGSGAITVEGTQVLLAGAQTGITSIYATDLIIGEDSQTAIDFGTADEIDFKINNTTELTLAASALYPVADAGLDLGTTTLGFNDLHLGSGGVINLDGGDVTLTHSANTLTVAGGTLAAAAVTGTTIDASTDFTIGDTVVTDGVITDTSGLALVANVTVTGNVLPNADDTYDLGSASAAWQDIFLEGDITLSDAGTIATSAGALTVTSADAATWSVTSGQLTIDAAGGIVINEDGDDEDFRIESDDDANMFVVNAGDDRVGIGLAAPVARLEVKSAGASTTAFQVTADDNTDPEFKITLQGDRRPWLQLYQGNTEKVRFDGGSDSFITNNLGVGVTSSISHILHISGQGRSTSSAWATSSDERIKTNIQDLSLGLDTIMGLRPRLYDYNTMGMSLGYKNPKADPEDDDTPRTGNIGFVGQEVEAVLPQAVQTLAQETVNRGTASEQVLSNFKIIDSAPLVPILVKAVQEAVAKINALDARIKILEA